MESEDRSRIDYLRKLGYEDGVQDNPPKLRADIDFAYDVAVYRDCYMEGVYVRHSQAPRSDLTS